MKIGNFNISSDSPAFIIAEISANHNGSIKVAIDTIKAAKKAGADCVKFQTYTADTITLNHKSHHFKITQDTIWDGNYLYDLYKEAFTPWEWHEELFQVCIDEGLEYFSSPFDKTAVDFLEGLNVPAYKIASFEITDIPLIEYVASKMKPIIISTGIANMDDIKLALEACEKVGNNDIALLKCTSSYPAPIDQANLVIIKDLSRKFNVISGLSDHTLGSIAPITSIALGGKIIEKHFILDKSIGGPDSSFSMDPNEFKEMVDAVRAAESSLGSVDYSLTEKQLKSREHSRSLFAVENIDAGEKITHQNVRSIRPWHGLHPKYLNKIIGSKIRKKILKGTPLDFSYVDVEEK
jgi:pseudaminic acid synthase